jgi:hypothetical protein
MKIQEKVAVNKEITMAIDSLATKDRVKWGKGEEKKCIHCMNDYLLRLGQRLASADDSEDMNNKTDAFLMELDHPGDYTRRCAVKVRDSGNDIEIALRDPWYGPKDPKTRIGRDVKLVYHWYIVRDKKKTQLMVADGKTIHRIAEELWEEYLLPDSPANKMRSKRYRGCEVRPHIDACHKHPKILAYVNPRVLKENEIFYVPYKESNAE